MGLPPLAHTLVTAAGATPTRWVYVLHGILGTRANWRTLARQMVDARPGWGAVLLDLRNHGGSRGQPPPHTLDTVTADVLSTAETLGLRVDAVVGHSYGGKVALAVTRARHGDLDAVVTVDSTPGPRTETPGAWSPGTVLDALDELPPRFARREDFLTAMTARGFSPAMAQWLAMNLERPAGADHVVLRVDTAAVRAMLADYVVRDLWSVVEHPPGRVRCSLLVGGRSDVYTATDRARALAAAAAWPDRVSVTVVPQAGHWMHVDAPEAVLQAVTSAMG